MTVRKKWLRRSLVAGAAVVLVASVGLMLRPAAADVAGDSALINERIDFGCLDGDINQIEAGAQFIRVQAFRCHFRENQFWFFEAIPGSSAKLIVTTADLSRSLCLEAPGGATAGTGVKARSKRRATCCEEALTGSPSCSALVK